MSVKSKKKDGGSKQLEEDLENSILGTLSREYQHWSADEEFASDVTTLFCGAKKSGKTSLVDRFINPSKDEKDVPRPTVALEYKFARYASEASTSKVLAHIYDLGGDEGNENLVAIPVSHSTVGNLVLAVILDLSEPHNALPMLEKWLKLLQAQCGRSLERLSQESASGARRVAAVGASRAELFAGHPDAQVVRNFPIPLVIFGTKWDVLVSEHDPEKKKGLCRALRYFAHLNGASLIFTSLKEKSTLANVRNVLRQLLFGVAAKGGLSEQTDHSKPLCVMAGRDTLQAIGTPNASTASPEMAWRELMGVYFPDPNRGSFDPKKSDGAQVAEELQKYPESTIDGQVEQRTEELQQYRRHVERTQRLASEGIDGRKDAATD